MDKLTALAIGQAAIGFILSEIDVLPAEFSRKELEQAAAELKTLAVSLEPARRKAILETLEAVDARKRGEIPADFLRFLNRLDSHRNMRTGKASWGDDST